MAEGHGGYRRPSNPAPASGPGKFSQRTDGGPKVMDMPNAAYGEAAEFEQIQRGAQMGSAPSGAAGSAPAPSRPMPTGFGAPTEMPGQPVTAGADAGAGPGSAVLGLPNPQDEAADLARRYGDILPYLIAKAESPRASQQDKQFVRYLIAKIAR